MKSLIEIVSTITLAATGLPPWVAIAVVVLALILLAVGRRPPKQTIIKTRPG